MAKNKAFFFNNTTIKGRLRVGFGLAALLLTLSVMLAIWQINAFSTQTGLLMKVSKPTQTNLLNLKNALMQTNNALQSFIIYKDPLMKGDRESLWNGFVNQTADSLKIYEQEWISLDDRVLFTEIVGDLDRLRRTQASVERVFDDNKDVVSAEEIEKTQIITKEIDDKLKKTQKDSINKEQVEAVFSDQNVSNQTDTETLLEGMDNVQMGVSNGTQNAGNSGSAIDFETILPQNVKIEYQKRIVDFTALVMSKIDRLYKSQQVQISTQENRLNTSRTLILVILVSIFVVGITMLFLFAKTATMRLTEGLQVIQQHAKEFGKGNIPQISTKTQDETSEILSEFNTLGKNMASIKAFALQVGQGQYETEISVFNNEGEIGTSLSAMKLGLLNVAQEDKLRNWQNEGFTMFSEILRDTADVQKLYDALAGNLVKYVSANQGGIFIATRESENDPFLELKSCYAYGKKKFIKTQTQLGEGLVGQCWQEGQTIYMTKVPKDYVAISSGLGSDAPRSVLIVPIKLGMAVYGVIELASFNVFTQKEKQFVEALGEDIAATISNLTTAEQTQKLLDESRSLTDQMSVHEAEILDNMQNLKSTKKELEKRTNEMEAMMTAIDKATVVMELDKAGNFMYVNEKFCEISQYKKEEVLGKHRSFYAPRDTDPADFNLLWAQLSSGIYLETTIKRVRKDGTIFWLMAYFFPVVNKEGILLKVTCIASDITNRIALEDKALEDQKTINFKNSAFENSFIIMETDSNFMVKSINRFGCDTLGIHREIVVGKHIDNAIIGRLDFRGLRRVLQSDGVEGGILMLKAGDKSYKFVNMRVSGVKDANLGTLESIFFMGTDITPEQTEANNLLEKIAQLERVKKVVE